MIIGSGGNRRYCPDLPFDVWFKIFIDLLSANNLSAREAAVLREALVSVCRHWHSMVYYNPALWSFIIVSHDMPLTSLAFDLHIVRGLPATAGRIHDYFEKLLSILAPTSHRWVSFHFITENPLAFARVSNHCRHLSAPAIETLRISYLSTPDYDLFLDPNSPAYTGPFERNHWFSGHLPRLRYAGTFCIPLPLSRFDSLETVELSDFTFPSPLSPTFLLSLFKFAVCMRRLRLGSILAFDIPDGFNLSSRSLEVVDLDFHRGGFAGSIFAALDTPSLTDLTVRAIRTDMKTLVSRTDILGRLVSFTVYHWDRFGDPHMLDILFSGMTSLCELNLQHTSPVVFHAYREWALSRIRLQEPNIAANLRVLRLPRSDFRSVVDIVNLVAQSMPQTATTVGIDLLRVERSVDYDASGSELPWIRAMVPDFAVTHIYHNLYPDEGAATPDSLHGFHAAHNLFNHWVSMSPYL
ncbi:hypothetical protein B0H16DRAFT_1732349 [Mycena metata]|uniref:F-box domain-containing protein n=1 Tax=Mycena metata TaxID=1033252 RepID=A0AAD7MUK2_9AGAR|nr:hypothetical protein B0H16DRAFT_1732349 [Mycena metata]